MRDLVIHSTLPEGSILTLVEMVNDYLVLDDDQRFYGRQGMHLRPCPDDTPESEIFDCAGDYTFESHVILVPTLFHGKERKRVPTSSRENDDAFDLLVSLWGLDYGIKRPEEELLERIAKLMSRGIGGALEMGECTIPECVMRPSISTYGENAALAEFIKDIEQRHGICNNHKSDSPVQ